MPSFVDNILTSLFPKSAEPVSVSGPLKWTTELNQKLSFWQPEGIKILQQIQADISRQRVIDTSELDLQWYNDRAANGLMADLSSIMPPEADLRLLGRLISNRVSNIGYRLYTAEYNTTEKGEEIENNYWFYLKPIPNIEEGQTVHDQKYGNVKIELIQRNERVHLKFLCTVYSGFNYSQPLPFDSLLREVFDAG